MKNFKNLLLVSLLFVATAVLGQGVTSSSASGKITDDTGEPLPGANVLLVHTPSGTKYGASTDLDGFFRVSNMRTGGPYKLTVSFVGFQTIEKQGIYLRLGGAEVFNLKLSEEANALQEVVVTASSGSKDGSETKVSRKQIASLPTISRSIADFARLTPQAQISGDNTISIAGQNNRFNAIYLDGAVNNDVFGLAASGTNGGQTGVNPISLDAIDQFQINIAPFDVKQSGFAGGSINAITRSGTNKVQASAYSFFRNESLAGKTPVDIAGDNPREKLAEFTALTYGARIGGAIKEDKLFYFVNYERQEDETPRTFFIDNYTGDSDALDIANLAQFIATNYNYNVGGVQDAISSLKSHKLIAKLDWNINDDHKLSLKHSFVKGINNRANASSISSINFSNGNQIFESITNTSTLELNSRFGNKYSNNLVLGYTSVNDDRGFNGNPFPNVSIRDGRGRINFGSEPFSTANLLETRIFTLTDNFEIYSGAHKFTIGTHNEFSSVNNVFFGRNFGAYEFASVSDFITNQPAIRYRLGYSLIGGNGDTSEGSAQFNSMQLGGYVQDEVTFSDRLKVTAGLRFDIPVWEDGRVNEDFNTRTVSLLRAAGKNLQGARVGQGIKSKLHISPRLGFTWDVNGDRKTKIRGGIGIFTSRVPLVWPGGAYNNNGVTSGRIDNQSRFGDFIPAFNPDVNSQFKDPAPGAGATGGIVDLFAADFMLPQVFKTNIAIDQKLPAGFAISADLILNDNIRAVAYENLNLGDALFTTTGPGGGIPNFGRQRIDNTYQEVLLASNTTEGKSWNFSTTLSKNYYSDFIDVRGQLSYSFGDSDVLNDGTSSQNISQWSRMENVRGANNLDVSRSDFAQGHRLVGNASIDFKWNDWNKTTLGFFYDAGEGNVFSYVYNDRGALTADTGNSNTLAYIPKDENDIILVDDGSFTAAEQWTALNAFIEGNDYLRSRRGQFAERNGDRARWSHVVDLKFAHEFSLKGKNNHSIELTADIFNFTNLLNKNWGKRYFSGSFNSVRLLNFEDFLPDGTTPTFTYNPRAETDLNRSDDAGLNSSRWQMQLGIRYKFN
ncbi:TonB-dependent receptor [Tenacibaculum jejuense]|uniref:Probable TonB-dependent outer membrane receptor n=1 Tax=Tenacibaculum jejuense TaxID=584609 RepID=A0A238UGX6_9FLAO|nr:TonB-dependent receptor [Tenacibaculum jejuense]SNR17590.1 Probable TonB-dependent outer membrane receptor precursor [Tenacibaculum jejuense]